MSNKLIIFDVDGTLTDTACIDSDIFLNAVVRYLGIERLNNNWDEYKYSTDSGVAREIFEKHRGCLPDANEISTIKEAYFSALLSKIKQNPECCNCILGAKFIFNDISRIAGWDTAVATGGWHESALMKLKHAKIDYQGSPIASGDDHVERREIINIAIQRSKQQYSKKAYEEIIYVGDRAWDYKAARDLGIGFIGVGHELRQANFNIPIIANYLNGSLVDLLNSYFVSVMK